MKLSILIHSNSVQLEKITSMLGITRVVKNFSHMGEFPFRPQITDLYVSSVNMQAAASAHLSPQMIGFSRVFLDMGMSPSSLPLAVRVANWLLETDPAIKIGYMQVQALLLKSKANYDQLFDGDNFIPVSMVGNGMSDLARELDTLHELYPKAIPCVLFMKDKDKRSLGEILVKYWDVFPELIFWSDATFSKVDIESVADDIRPLRFTDNMRYIALQPTTIREGASLGSRGLGRQTEPGKVYQIKEVIPTGEHTFGKLEDGTYVVIDQPYFQKETY